MLNDHYVSKSVSMYIHSMLVKTKFIIAHLNKNIVFYIIIGSKPFQPIILIFIIIDSSFQQSI